MASRLTYGMACQGIVPSVFARVLDGRRTPLNAILFTASLCGLLVLTGDLASLADTTVLLLLVVFILVNVSVLVLRRDAVEHAHFHAPTVFPVVGIAVCVALMTQKSGETYARAGALLALGVAFWLVNRLVTGPRGPFDTRELEVVEGR